MKTSKVLATTLVLVIVVVTGWCLSIGEAADPPASATPPSVSTPAPATTAPVSPLAPPAATAAAAPSAAVSDFRAAVVASYLSDKEKKREAPAATPDPEEILNQAFKEALNFYIPQLGEHEDMLKVHGEKLTDQESRLQALERARVTGGPVPSTGDPTTIPEVVQALKAVEARVGQVEKGLEDLRTTVSGYTEAARAEFGHHWQQPSILCLIAESSVKEVVEKGGCLDEAETRKLIETTVRELSRQCNSPQVAQEIRTTCAPKKALPPQMTAPGYAWGFLLPCWRWNPCTGEITYFE